MAKYPGGYFVMLFVQLPQSKPIHLNTIGVMQLLFWLLSSLHFRVGTTNSLCDRIYFNHGDETKMPYVQLEGIYSIQTFYNGYPIYKHEQRNYYFEYLDSNDGNLMAFNVLDTSKSQRSYVGLRASMTQTFNSPNWVQQITDSIQPFHKFIFKWEYYDWQSQTHISITGDAVSLICVPSDVYRCSSQRIHFNTTFTNSHDGEVFYNHLNDYFEELTGGYNAYKNYRKKYRHSRNSDWLLYYENPYWKVKSDKSSSNTPFVRVKDSSLRPEYITATWQHLDGSWKSFFNHVGIRCRGVVQYHGDGSVKTCKDSNPCLNSGTCVDSKSTNEAICHCRESFTGPICEQKQRQCSTFLYDETTVKHVVVHELESSSFASVFCKENYKPQYFLSQCVIAGNSTRWMLNGGCFSSNPNESKEAPLTFDDYLAIRLILPVAVCGLQFLATGIHIAVALCRKRKYLRILSAHAFLSFVCWAMYFLGCTIANCLRYGKVFNDLLKISYVITPLSYVAMLFESTRSEERDYISSILTHVSVINFVDKLKRTVPQRKMTVCCYHWETRMRLGRCADANGNSALRTGICQVRVDKHKENKMFPVGSAQDISDREGLNLDSCRITKLKLKLAIECGDEETNTKFAHMRQKMIDDNKDRDACIDFQFSDDIEGFQKRICAYTDTTYRPWWMNPWMYWASSILGFTWIFRILFNYKTTKSEYTIKQLIYCVRECESDDETSSSDSEGTSNQGFCASSQHMDLDIDNIQGNFPTGMQKSPIPKIQVGIVLMS